MTFDYRALQGLASGLMAEFKQGEAFLLKRTRGAGPSYNPGPSGWVVIPLNAVAKGVNGFFWRQGLADASELTVTSAVVAGVEVDQPDDKIIVGGALAPDGLSVVGGVQYKITRFSKVPPMGDAIVWKFTVSK